MSKKTRQSVIIAGLVVLIIAAGAAIYVTYIKPISISVLQPLPQKKVITLYFYNPDTDTLKPEQRAVVPAATVTDTCRTIIAELELGSHTGLTTPIPANVAVNDANIRPDGTLFLDLNQALVAGTPEGSSAEITALYSIVNSLAKNISGVKAVQITINGKLFQTLETHIEIDQPIVPDYSK